jgi:DNA-binding XRE family transcriptional regulator
VYAEFGRTVRQARVRLGISQNSLAERVGLSRTSITNIEKGKQRLMLHTAVEMASVLSVPISELVPLAMERAPGEVERALSRTVEDEVAKSWVLKAIVASRSKS